ncbi:protein kinase domain-containing protein [Haematococcus lacustris]|uniref:Protein kinase domain-containing protein n=1 Tax=Haematococcus lacustris TaxID=44745 RepID=A0A699YJA2_HAELA|nr:protein kinase domain-containing protein [Haematococcus lacustris]
MRPLLQDRDGVVRTMPADPELQATGATCPQAPATGEGTTTDESLGTDSFDKAPETDDALLINRMEMSRDMQRVHLQQPSVAQQLRALVNNMQQELEEQEVEVSRVIGQGGFGVVYQGTWRGLTVAVKTLVFTVLPSMPAGKRQQRAMTEAAICRTMQHPNIVATYAYDLQAHVLQLATDIAAGMAHVHSRNVVHGDLTPSNVLLRTASNTLSGFVAKIADFGLSWKLAGGQEHVSNARQGTAYYIAPEVLHVGIMSKPADVFAFGMLLHEVHL